MTTPNADLLLAIDQGTTSTRAIAFDLDLEAVANASRPLQTRHPQPGWVEEDPEAILRSVVESVAEVLAAVGGPGRVAAVGLDNQGETVVAWDADTGHALAPAIVWQCRRSTGIVERLRAAGHEPAVRAATGLPLDAYFSAGKMRWLLEEDAAVQAASEQGTLRFGTVDAWLTRRLAGQALSDPSTASRTQLYDLHRGDWSPSMLALFGVSPGALPRIVPTAGLLGTIEDQAWRGSLPLRALAIDQMAALAGHGLDSGTLKATYGTGVFVVANTGPTTPLVDGIETSVAWQLGDTSPVHALQGGVFTAGAVLDWLRDDLGVVADVADVDAIARSVPDTAGVQVLPALAGLGAPWWQPAARLVISGLTGAADRRHVVRATLDAIAQRTNDIVEVMVGGLPEAPSSLRVDGGLTASAYLMERQADLLGYDVEVAANEESTALGIAALAGVGAGLIPSGSIARANPVGRRFAPRLAHGVRQLERETWRKFVMAARAL